jgi:hypothetical protein
LSSD